MSRVEIAVREVLSNHLGIDYEAVTKGKRIVDLGADSLDNVEIVMELEEKLGVDLLDVDIEGIQTVGELIDVTERKANER